MKAIKVDNMTKNRVSTQCLNAKVIKKNMDRSKNYVFLPSLSNN
mgnify:CR=1 FL=1